MGSVKIPVFIMRLSVLIILSSPVVSAIRQIEGLIDQWKIRHNVAENGVFEEGPILPRRIVRVATTDGSVWATFECDYNRSAPALDQAKSKLVRFSGRTLNLHWARRHIRKKHSAESNRFKNFIESDLHSCGDVPRGLGNYLHVRRS